jgi:hypothetical protein
LTQQKGRKPRSRLAMFEVLCWLELQPKIDRDKVNTVRFLNGYRNAFHKFNRYEGQEISCRGLRLCEGERLPVIQPEVRVELLSDLFDLFLAVDGFW